MFKIQLRYPKLVLTIGLLLCLGFATANADTLDDAKNAYGAGEFDEAITLLRPLVRQENKEAAFLLGRMYEQGDGIDKDLDEAKRLYRIAAEHGHDGAQQRLDIFDARGADQSVVIEWYLPAAHEGDTEAQYNLGFMYETGWGVPVNEPEAVKWYLEASEMQHDIAQLRLGMMLILGVGTKANATEGIDLIRNSAENGNRIAEAIIQDIYDVGELKPEQSSRIIAGLRRVLDEGEPKALEILRRSLRDVHKRAANKSKQANGSGTQTKAVIKQTPKPKFNIVESVTKKNVDEKPHDTIASSEELLSKPKSPKVKHTKTSSSKTNMFQFYSESANRGDADAQFHLGAMYIKGEQVKKDVDEGLYWVKLAAEQGHEMAISYLELWEDDISSTALNASVGINWLKEAGRGWDMDAIFNLGFLYESGRGVEVNFKKAMQWYRFSAVEGHADAKRRLALLKQGKGLTTEGVSNTQAPGDSFAMSLELIIGVVLLLFAVIGIVMYIKRERHLKMPSMKREEQEVFEKANAAHGMEADDRKFFDELWEPKISEKPAADVSSRRPAEAKKPEPKPEVEPAIKSPELSEVEKKLARAVDDLIGVKTPEEPVVVREKMVATTNEKPKDVMPLEDLVKPKVDSEQIEIAKIENDIARKTQSAPKIKVPKVEKSANTEVGIEESKLGADAFLGNSISRDALAASRVSADNLFADGVAIDSAGKAVGRGSFNPNKLDADSMLSSDSISLRDSSSASKPQKTFGPAAGLLPKKSIEEEIAQDVDKIHESSTMVEQSDDSSLTQNEERSLAEVHFNIGVMFSAGDGVPKNDVQAAKWFLKAAEEGLSEAQFNIGQSYLHGTGVAKNAALGMEWIRKAADNGYQPAQDILSKKNRAI